MTNFVCMNCGYRFESSGEEYTRRCSNCGEKRIKKEQSAASLLDDITGD